MYVNVCDFWYDSCVMCIFVIESNNNFVVSYVVKVVVF